jgi:hypothetical protein
LLKQRSDLVLFELNQHRGKTRRAASIPVGKFVWATSAEPMRALRERERRGLRRFKIGVSEDDLRLIAEHGYEGAGKH